MDLVICEYGGKKKDREVLFCSLGDAGIVVLLFDIGFVEGRGDLKGRGICFWRC